MKNIKRTLALLLAMVMVLTMLPLVAVAEDQTETPSQTAEPQFPDPGAINLKKEAHATENDYEYEITLTIEGKNYHTSSDVVLVIDKSGSMDGNRIKNTRTAAKAFGDKLLTKGSETRIAIVTYNDTATAYNSGHFYTATELESFKTAVDNATKSVTGGTNQQAGIHKAQELLNSDASTGKLKNIVLLSDGEPTYSYKLTGTATWINCSQNGRYHSWNDGWNEDGQIDESTIAITGCNYDSLKGSGYAKSSFHYRSGELSLTVTCEHGETLTDTRTQDHSVATIWEANQAKAKGTTVYSVALQADTDGEATLKSCASDSTKGYFAISKNETDVAGKLNTAFTAIAGSIAIAASGGKVTDPMSEYVTFKPAGDKLNDTKDEDEFATGNYDVYISQGSVSWDEATATFTWETGNINEGVPAIMKYRVTLNDNVELGGDPVPTNKTTTFDYTNYLQKRTTKDFNPIPTVTKGGGTITLHFYRVDADGNPVNGDGVQVDTPSQAEVLAEARLYAVDGKTSLEYGTYPVPADAIENAVYYGYTLSEDVAVQSGTPSVTLNKKNSVANVWFAYQAGFQIVHVQDGEAGLPETYAVEENFNITEEVSREYLYGGTFSDEDCQDVWDWDYENENPTDFTPEAGATYYIWEVSQTYLMPKLYRAYAHPTAYNGEEYVTQLHLLTTVDRKLYTEVGFFYGDDTVTPELSETVEVTKNGELYEKLYVAEDGSLGSKKAAKVDEIVSGTGCVVTYSLTAEQFAAFEGTSGTPVTYEPYWITLDGVKVTNAQRTATHQGAGYNTVKVDDQSDLTVEYVLGGTEPEALAVMAVYTLDYDAAPAAPVVPDEPVQPATVTITVHDGDTYKIAGEPGAFDVAPKGAEGKLFAGWYADEAFTEVADLTDVQEDADIYAKYVSDNYLQVKYNNLGLLGRGSLRLVSAVDSKAYAETGFVVNGEKLVVSSYTTRYNLQTGKTLFGVGRNDPLMVASYSYKNLRRGDTIEIRAYWITPDGTTVYGDVRTLTYGRFGLEG